jgi:hypothetical protein
MEFPSRDRTIMYVGNTHQRHIRIQIDKTLLFGKDVLGIYLIYFWNMSQKIYTWCIYTCQWYLPGFNKIYTMLIPDAGPGRVTQSRVSKSDFCLPVLGGLGPALCTMTVTAVLNDLPVGLSR